MNESKTSPGKNARKSAREKNVNMKKSMEMLLSLPASADADRELLSDLGVPAAGFDGEINNMLVVNAALIKAAKSGNVSAVKELRSIIRDDDYIKHKIKTEKERLELEKEKLHTDNTETLKRLDEILKAMGGDS